MGAHEIAGLYERLSSRFGATVEAVPDDRWDAPSSCTEWSNRDVVRHVVELHAALLAAAQIELPGGASVDDDPASAWTRVRSAALSALADPASADREFDSGFAGTTTLAQIFGTFGAVDLVIHRWDLAHGAGVDDTIPPEDLDLVWDFVHDKGDMLRGSDSFAAAIEVGPDASQQERVLGFLGRAA